jgi:hypothetical protein
LNKLNKGLIFSIIFHLILLVIITQHFSQSPLKIVKKNKPINPIKPIQARLYFPPAKKQPTVALEKVAAVINKNIPKNEKITITKRVEKTLPKPEKITEKAYMPPKISPKKTINKNVLTSDSSSKNIAQNSLEKLQQRLNTQVLEYSQNDSFNQYLTDKNTIAPSITKFNQLPIAKAKIKEVDCNSSALNTAVMVVSGFLGGSVKCNSIPNLKEFLDKRVDERGK